MNSSDDLVLLVEDDPDQVLFVQRAFNKLRISNPLHVVTNGEAAISYLWNRNKPPPSLILLDLKVPRIRGLAILEWIRRQPDLREIPVVIVTSSIEPDDLRRAEKQGVSAFLCKPVSAEGLRELVETTPSIHLVRQT
jgi:CheY-like chemotaxis protein